MSERPDLREWLEADGLGGFASGTVSGIRTRRYHALLLAAVTPPTGRTVLVNGLEAWLETPGGVVSLSSQRYAPDVLHPDGWTRLSRFEAEPWPRWHHSVSADLEVRHELLAVHEAPLVLLGWELSRPAEGVTLCVRPLISGRDYHALHHENPGFDFAMTPVGPGSWTLAPYRGVSAIALHANGDFVAAPEWYRRFAYVEEEARGLDAVEDLASPGVLRFALSRAPARLALGTVGALDDALARRKGRRTPDFPSAWSALRESEQRRRRAFSSPLARAADAYVVRRGAGRTIVAGYPWFADWGRDTFIALRGLCLATGRLDVAREILLEWSGAVSAGMLPNRFADTGETPEYNAVDASLWYVVALGEYLRGMRARDKRVPARDGTRLREAVDAILSGYARGTRFGIRLDGDGLLASGERGVQLTWMDAKIGDWVVTPRTGKAVEVQALWLNALAVAGEWTADWKPSVARGHAAFVSRFWSEATGCLRDVVDCDHVAGRDDDSVRPNQILALGGLPVALLDAARTRRALDVVEARLWTPAGLRSLAPGSPGYTAQYRGGPRERDAAYHQGTVWPWLAGPFVEAWLRAHADDPSAVSTARARFLAPLEAQLERAGLGHLFEVADAEPPHAPGGCPFQAWSLAALLQIRAALGDRATPE